MTANALYVCDGTLLSHQAAIPSGRSSLPDLPVLPWTLLALDLHRHEFSFDLRAISQILLEDLGATLQIFRMANRKSGESSPQHQRIEDCISEWGFDACLAAVERGTHVRPGDWRNLLDIWSHARRIACCSRKVAEQKDGGIHPDHAYLAGLLHQLASLPELLGWERCEFGTTRAATALALASRWCLPTCIQDFFCEELMPGWDPRWTELMAEAHRLAGSGSSTSR